MDWKKEPAEASERSEEDETRWICDGRPIELLRTGLICVLFQDPDLRVGDVVIPARWALYQKQHFAKEREDGSHEIPGWGVANLWGEECGSGLTGSEATATLCVPGMSTFNYSFMYPTATYGADPTVEGVDATSEGSRMYGWFDVDPEMFAIAEQVAPSVVLSNAVGENVLDYQPVVLAGGNGVAGPTFLDNPDYREHIFDTFGARAVDMETSAAAHVATQFGKKFIFFRSLSDLAGGEDEGNALGVFFGVAASNAVATMSAFLTELPIENNSEGLPVPNDHSPGEATEGLLGVLSFYQPELEALKTIMNQSDEPITELVFGGRKFYRGKIAGADVVATLTGVSISNAAMTTALMAMLYPGVERIVGGGIAGGVDPSLRVGDVVIPERWGLYQMQVYARMAAAGHYEPVNFAQSNVVGDGCGGYDGVDTFLTGDGTCDFEAGQASNFGFIFPQTVQTPWPNDPVEVNTITEGPTRKWWFEADPEMLEVARNAIANVVFKNEANNFTLPYTPEVVVGGNGVSGPTFVDNARYREYVFEEFQARCFEEFQARCLDMETAASAHIAYQNDIPFLFFRSLSDLAGADQDGNVIGVFFTVAAENAFAVTYAFIEAMYPVEEATTAPTDAPTSSGSALPVWRSVCMVIAALVLFVGL